MNTRSFGFTLVELIVVLVILSILSAVAVPSVLGFIDDSKAKECRTQVEALTAEISSAKLAYEANGEVSESGEVGREFGKDQIVAYIAAAGDEGCCPVDDVSYEYKQDENKIVCPKGHGEGVISNSGKFTVAVAEDTSKREPDDVLPPKEEDEDNPGTENPDTNEPDTDEPKPKHTYTARIVPPEDVSLDNMEEGDTAGLTVEVRDENGELVDPSRVTVEWTYPEDGSVSGPEEGTDVSVEAKHSGGGQIQCKVTVKEEGSEESKPADCAPVDVTVKKKEHTYTASVVTPGDSSLDNMEEGDTAGLKVEVRDENGELVDPSRVTVEWTYPEDGSVSGPEEGTDVSVEAKHSGGGQIQCKVTVKEEGSEESKPADCAPVDVTVKESETGQEETDTESSGEATITMTPASVLVNIRDTDKLANGDKMIFDALLTGDTTGMWLDWSVAPEGIITLSPYNEGNIFGNNNYCGFKTVKTGTCTVTARLRGKDGDGPVASCEVTVYQPLDSISLSDGINPINVVSLKSGEQTNAVVKYDPEDASFKDVIFSSEDESIVTVDEKGHVNVIGKVEEPTSVKIYAACPQPYVTPDRSAYMEIQVSPLCPSAAHMAQSEVNLYIGQSHQAEVVVDSPKSDYVVLKIDTWSSDSNSVATVDGNGLITAVGEGTCTVTALVWSKYEESTIPVTATVNVKKAVMHESAAGTIAYETSEWNDYSGNMPIRNTETWKRLTEQNKSRLWIDENGNAYALTKYMGDEAYRGLNLSTWPTTVDAYIENNVQNWEKTLVKVNSLEPKDIQDETLVVGDIVSLDVDGVVKYYVLTEEITERPINAENIAKFGGEVGALLAN